MKYIFYFLFLLIASNLQGQTYAKINGVTALVLIPNIGLETSISKKNTFSIDINTSLWKSVNNAPLEFVLVTPEVRHYFKQKYQGIYFGLHLGFGAFNIQKWNYTNTTLNQKGFNYFLGGTLGYEKKISEKMLLEFFVGGGSIQSFYKGYDLATGKRVESATRYNKSGEFIPYRGGIMICYRLE
jgi:hypothetical protein